jgi:predicted transcriptional regulator of viral defense system
VKVDEWLNFFKKHSEKKLFSLSDLAQLTGISKSVLSVQLTRLVKAKVIKRAAQVWYENPFNTPSNEEIAMAIRYPAYISMEYALSKHGILSQSAYTLTLITTKLPYVYNTKQTLYEYHQITKSLFWGYKKEGTVLIAEAEKALLDLIYIRHIKNKELSIGAISSLTNDMSLDAINLDKLQKYSKEFSSKTRKTLYWLNILKKEK